MQNEKCKMKNARQRRKNRRPLPFCILQFLFFILHFPLWLSVLLLAIPPTSSRAQTVTQADFNANGVVDFPDFLMFVQAYGTIWSRFNLDGQGKVDFADFLIFANFYGQVVKPPDFQVDPQTFLDDLYPDHPRLILKESDLEALKAQEATDPALQKIVAEVLRDADYLLDDPPLVHQLIGPRLLSVSRKCLDRIYSLGMAWRWTGDDKYARIAVENLLAVCAFPDWNPSHFLDTAEMSHAVGIGYDWLYHYMDAQTRATVKAGLIKHGMIPGRAAYDGTGYWWVRSAFNWNQVCNGGLISGALAIAETDPKYAQTIVPKAVRSLPTALRSYTPDGAWGEGPGYWHYATRYTAYGIASLESALGKDYGLKGVEGLSLAGHFPIYTAGPTNYFLNYADSGEKAQRRPMACSFWLAKVYDDGFVAHAERALLAEQPSRATPQHLMWYMPEPAASADATLDKLFHGVVEVAVFRSAWDDPNALFAGIKAGYNQVNHGHLDLGNFEVDALGVRWARDLGSDDYNMPGYFSSGDGQRWQYYRLNSFSHNVPLLDGKGQYPGGEAEITRFETDGAFPFAQVDISSAYPDYADSVKRGLALLNGRKTVLIQDEFQLKTSCEIAWGMTTDAGLSLGTGEAATLYLDNKQLRAVILSPQGARFSAESAEQQPPEKTNKGVWRLLIKMPNQQGSVRLAVWLVPEWGDGQERTPPEIKPLAEWGK